MLGMYSQKKKDIKDDYLIHTLKNKLKQKSLRHKKIFSKLLKTDTVSFH